MARIRAFSFRIPKHCSHARLRDFLIVQADTGVRYPSIRHVFMGEALRSDPSPSAGELPDQIYIGFVDGLLADFLPSVVLSAVAVMVGEIASAIAARSLILAVAAPAQLLIVAARLHFARQH